MDAHIRYQSIYSSSKEYAEKLDAAMAEAGVLDQRKLGWF